MKLRCFSQQLYPHALLELVDLTIVTHILITALQNSTEQSLPESWHCPSQFTLYGKEGGPGKWNHLPHAKNNTWTLVAINSLIPIEGIPIPNSSLVTSLLLFLSSSQSITMYSGIWKLTLTQLKTLKVIKWIQYLLLRNLILPKQHQKNEKA